MALITPKRMAWVHFSLSALWLCMIPIALTTGLSASVPFLVTISLLALVFGELAAWQAAMGERRQDPTDPYGEE